MVQGTNFPPVAYTFAIKDVNLQAIPVVSLNSAITTTSVSITAAGTARCDMYATGLTEAGLIVYELVGQSYNEIARASSTDITLVPIIGANLFNFSASVSGLKAGTSYYVRLYATDKFGTGYSDYMEAHTQ